MTCKLTTQNNKPSFKINWILSYISFITVAHVWRENVLVGKWEWLQDN